MNLTKHTYAHTFGQKSTDFLFGLFNLTVIRLISGSPGFGWLFPPPPPLWAGCSANYRISFSRNFFRCFFDRQIFLRVHRLRRRLFPETPRHRDRRLRGVLPLSRAKFN